MFTGFRLVHTRGRARGVLKEGEFLMPTGSRCRIKRGKEKNRLGSRLEGTWRLLDVFWFAG